MIPAGLWLWTNRIWVLVGVALLMFSGLYAYNRVLVGRVEAATQRAYVADARRQEAEERARMNAEAVERLNRLHEEQLAAISRDARVARERAERTARTLEALRRDPSHSTAAAPVLGAAVERLRKRRPGIESSPSDDPAGSSGTHPQAAPAAR